MNGQAIFTALCCGFCIAAAAIPGHHPTPVWDALLYGLAAVFALLSINSALHT